MLERRNENKTETQMRKKSETFVDVWLCIVVISIAEITNISYFVYSLCGECFVYTNYEYGRHTLNECVVLCVGAASARSFINFNENQWKMRNILLARNL